MDYSVTEALPFRPKKTFNYPILIFFSKEVQANCLSSFLTLRNPMRLMKKRAGWALQPVYNTAFVHGPATYLATILENQH